MGVLVLNSIMSVQTQHCTVGGMVLVQIQTQLTLCSWCNGVCTDSVLYGWWNGVGTDTDSINTVWLMQWCLYRLSAEQLTEWCLYRQRCAAGGMVLVQIQTQR